MRTMKITVKILLFCVVILLAAVIGDLIDIVHLISLIPSSIAGLPVECQSELIKGVAAIFAALLAAGAAAYGVKSVNEQKSFELLTKQRLQTFNLEEKYFAELRLLSSPESLKIAKKSGNKDTYMLDIRKVICELQSLLSGVELHEHLLMNEVDILRDKLEIYLSDETDTLDKVAEQLDIVNTFIDIYLWSLWNYIQTLHKEKNREKRQKKFDEELKDNYDRAKKLSKRPLDKEPKNEQCNEESKEKPTFFDKYSVEMLTNHQKEK